jgi:serine/threonine-protein kinase
MRERDDAALVGTVLQDSYRLTRLIGAGGMGAVYEGVQLRLNKRVAVKLMMKELAANQEALARFRREAEVTSHLGHPHIVNVFDFGTTPAGASYLVMEYLEGEDLDHRLRRAGQQSLAATTHVVKQVASALAATHAKGVVHRDLKPANLFVLEVEGETDFVKVVDFGISKVRAATTKLTGASAVMGTPNYMSPEQARGQIDEIDHRTDQWSLACIAYEMLTGRGPFVGESAASLLYQVIHEEPPPIAKRARGIPAEVEKVIRRGLAKKMDDRYPSVTAFARALEAAGSGKAAGARAPEQMASVGRAEIETAPSPSTTFSNTASEILPDETETPRGGSKRLLVAGAAAALVAIVAVAALRSGPPTPTATTAQRSAAPAAAAPAPPPAVQPVPAAPPPAPPPTPVVAAPAPARAPVAVPPPPAPAPAATVSHRTRRTPPTPAAPAPSPAPRPAAAPAAPAPAAKPRWVDPFEQDNGSKPAAKPKRRLIEDL